MQRSNLTLIMLQDMPTMLRLTVMMLVTMMTLTLSSGGVEAASSSLHYQFDHSYGHHNVHSPYLGYKHKHGHHYTDIGINMMV